MGLRGDAHAEESDEGAEGESPPPSPVPPTGGAPA